MGERYGLPNSHNTAFLICRCLRFTYHAEIRGSIAAKPHAAWRRIQGRDASLYLIAGDITNGCAEEEFSIAQAGLKPIIEKTLVLIAYGNHDYIPNNQGAVPSPKSRKAFSN